MTDKTFRTDDSIVVLPSIRIASRWHHKHGIVRRWSAFFDIYLVLVDSTELALRASEMRRVHPPLTGEQKIKQRGITGTFDWALPHDWFCEVLDRDLPNPSGHVIWLYDSTCGRPVGIDPFGDEIVKSMETPK
jgi:hypothetical protein